MEWNQLQTFLVAAREENFSKAAELLYTFQPSLSKTIKRLEEELGYPLFEREGKRIRLNEYGKIWVQTMGQMESMYEDTKVRLEEPILLAVPRDHHLADAEEITVKDLEKEEFISLNDNWALSRNIFREMRRIGFVPKITMWLDNPNLMRELLKQHMGAAFVPSVTWKSFAEPIKRLAEI